MWRLSIGCVSYIMLQITQLNCQQYNNRPKIKTEDGNLFIESAYDKNIYLTPNGPNSNVYVGNINLNKLGINITNEKNSQYLPSTSVNSNSQVNGLSDILQRLENLEMLPYNISTLRRRINRLTARLAEYEMDIGRRAIDQCLSHPCRNGGTCLNLVGGYHCMCPTNWEGSDCDVDVNECRNFVDTDLGCQNGAACINKPGSYECICRSGWFGVHCTRKLKDCSGGDYEMCGHGHCIPTTTVESIICICKQGWTNNGTGVACLTDVNECDSSLGHRCSVNPKVDCINLPGSFRCGQCPHGYEGDGYVCSDIDECSILPNGGCSTRPLVQCINTIGSRVCGPCPPGYQGDGITCTWRGSCSINHGGCHPSARCIEYPTLGGQTAQCECPEGMDGDGIGIHGCYVSSGNMTHSCENNPCGSRGRCINLPSAYTCLCYRGYRGIHCDKITNYCLNDPCQNGGTCRSDETTVRGFRCECTAQYSGDLCQIVSRTCGGILREEEGSIVYPLYNTTYKHDSRCAWVIQTHPDKVINVTFSKFDIEDHNECAFDFLQIHDGRSSGSQLIGRFCGTEFPNGGNIVSSHNNLYFWFRSDKTVAKKGFALHWTSVQPSCGGEVNATVHGHISSPGSPGPYPPKRDCYWHLTTNMGKRIQLHFFELDIESHENCSYDYLAIYDGERENDPLLTKLCSTTVPPPLQSSSSKMMIHFHSDSINHGKGFQISFAPIEGIPGCGGYFTGDRGQIVSPSYKGRYLPNMLCEYRINTGPGTKIRLDFMSFNIENSLNCRFDYVKIYDGPSPESRLVGKFCGISHPTSYVSSANNLFIKFRSDSSTAGNGFTISYKALCQQTLTGDSGIVKSPGYPFSYPENIFCEYIIAAAPGKAIQLTFQDFNLEDSGRFNCNYDSVVIRDGHDANSTLLGTFCGKSLPPVQISTHNYMYIGIRADMSVSGLGFYANYTTVDVECGGIYKDSPGIINFPKNGELYKNNLNCIWMLVAAAGMHIQLTWNRFHLEDSSSCSNDYLKLIEIDDENNEYNLGTYCSNSLPPALTSTTSRLKLNFVSDSSVRTLGFSVSFSFLDEKTHCDGTFVSDHGYIYSPGWPKRYQINRNCTWLIMVSAGQQISLNISQFDLERPIGGHCNLGDYLEVRNGRSSNSPLVGKYCGSFASKRIISLSNVLYLHFYSDSYITGSGFKIQWDGTISGCGGTLIGSSGELSSPNYPQHYFDNAECVYKISTNSGSKLIIHFIELDLEKTSDCTDDYVEIYDGKDDNSPGLGKYCSMSSKLNDVQTLSNYATIKFRSDFYISRKGFLLNYETICHNNLSGSYGIIESPGYPNSYAKDLNCLWTINVPKGNKINITFTDFNIYSRQIYNVPYRPPYFPPHSDRHSYLPNSYHGFPSWRTPLYTVQLRDKCSLDYLQMKEASESNFTERFCGDSRPSAFTSKSNSLQIRFVTSSLGSMIPRPGFRLEWSRYGCGGTILKNFGILKYDKNLNSDEELDCEWIIQTRIGTSISINFTKVYIADTTNCSTDVIEIYNGQSISSPLLTRFCHGEYFSVRSTSNTMLVKFVKQSVLRDVHFKANFISLPSQCGGYINSLSGFIYSKNYPKNYENNLNCIWSVQVPINHRIELNIMDLDIFRDISDENECVGDFIKVYDGGVFSKNYSKIICVETQVSKFVSKSNTLGLQFISDSTGTAKGFKANFSVVCGGVIEVVNDGIISTDRFVSHSDVNCTWSIIAPKLDRKISMTITHMSIPKNLSIVSTRHCPSSFLRVYDGDDDKAPLIDEYCGRKVPSMIVSHGNALTIQLGSYFGKISGQFSAHYTTLDTACGGTLTSEEGTIASPNYPQFYPPNIDCEWILSTSVGNRVYLTFERFDLMNSEGCNEDYVEVRENDGSGKLLGLYCGPDLPTNTTTATKLYIKLHSDKANSGQGFIMHYGFLHGNDINGLDHGEIASPLFPHLYDGPAEYTWRIFTGGSRPISIVIDRLEIPVYGRVCYNYLAIFDGYDDTAPLIRELCGIDVGEPFQSSSSVVFIKLKLEETNPGSLFHLTWAKNDKDIEEINTNKVNCGSNGTQIVTAKDSVIFNSTNYPDEYENNANCEWVFKTELGHHLVISFIHFELEETSGCFADYVSIYSSDTGMQWKPVIEKTCLSEVIGQKYNASIFLKVVFISDVSITRTGFQASVQSVCGGILSSVSGVISSNSSDVGNVLQRTCEWKIKVRPGRTVKLYFDKFNIINNNPNGDCKTYLLINNGESSEAPLLNNNAKYCGFPHENLRGNLESSSNSVFVRFVHQGFTEKNNSTFFQLRYEEKNIECGTTSVLDSEHRWETIHSPNYPSVPSPFTECIWIFKGPPGEILRIDFIDRFDIKKNSDCLFEVVEIRDGTSNLAPVIGQFCGEKPSTVKTSNNAVYIKYVTKIQEPQDGFKANISIDVCGGTFIAESGEIESPNFPHMQIFPPGTVCEWRIVSKPSFIVKITALDLDLPDSETLCGTAITIEEKVPVNNTIIVIKKFCNEDMEEEIGTVTETFTNEVIIKLHVDKSSKWESNFEKRGFRFSFNTSRPMCGGLLTSPEGFIMTPGYPRESTVPYCQWSIKVPDKSRRVRLEILDDSIDLDIHRIGIYNDLLLRSAIISLSSSNLVQSKIFESSGNEMALYLWLKPSISRHRFKARFSSDYEALCGGSLISFSGELTSPVLERSYSCQWQLSPQLNYMRNMSNFNSLFVTVKVNSSVSRTFCRYSDPQLYLTSKINSKFQNFDRSICGNKETTMRIPSNEIEIKALQSKGASLYFDLHWKLQPCGGLIQPKDRKFNIINVPNLYNDSIDCAWLIEISNDIRVNLTLDGTFQLGCDDEFIKISQGTHSSSNPIGDYCRERKQDLAIIASFKYIYVEYHSNLKNNTNIRLTLEKVSHQCGGYLYETDYIFASPNYPKTYQENQECAWEIHAEFGYRISLGFIERFAIEMQSNCSKDAVIIYDWINESYKQIAKLCGRNLPITYYNSTNNKMKVILRTDSEYNLDGFKAQWAPICGGSYLATEKQQFLYSPGYPARYKSLLDCSYEILAPGEKIMVKFLDFDLEGGYPECKYDNLTIQSPYGAAYSENINYFFRCGSESPPEMIVRDKIMISFKTDDFVEKKGFMMSYSISTCGGVVKTPSVLTSGPRINYENDLNCTWSIEAPQNKIVVLKFLFVDLEEGNECNTDFLEVYDGPYIDYEKRLALLCGHINSSIVLRSTGNKMLLHFVTDIYVTYKGFKAEVMFSYSESVGCGGYIDLTSKSDYYLKSPLFGTSVVYENYLDCHWSFIALPDKVFKLEFTNFHVSPCRDVNQTALGISKCDCDFVEIKDGLNPTSETIGIYCGHNLPPQLISSQNTLSVRFSTDGEIASSGFQVKLTIMPSSCGPSQFKITNDVQNLKSPNNAQGFIPRSLHCSYYFDASDYPRQIIAIHVKDLDLQPSDKNICDRDRLLIRSNKYNTNTSLGRDLILSKALDDFLQVNYYFEDNLSERIELCGKKKTADLYVTGSFSVDIRTSPESDTHTYKGFEIEVYYKGKCGRNYTEPYGRLQSNSAQLSNGIVDCYTLIRAPKNCTISLYFTSVMPAYYDPHSFLEIYDGESTSSPVLLRVATEYDQKTALFSTSQYMLLYNRIVGQDQVYFDGVYLTTDKGRGCGGTLTSPVGVVTSPLYPEVYRETGSCEWELETSVNTRLHLHFSVFDLGKLCDQNYVALVNRDGATISRYCSEIPADYISNDNYVKIVFTTTRNNGGTGWVAEFLGARV